MVAGLLRIAPCCALFAFSLIACGGGGRAGGADRIEPSRASPQETARPVFNPAERSTAFDMTTPTGLEQVVVRVDRAPDGSLRIVDFLSPGLSEAQKMELARAVESGELAPEAAAMGARTWITTLRRR
jgi:hypothetical protein